MSTSVRMRRPCPCSGLESPVRTAPGPRSLNHPRRDADSGPITARRGAQHTAWDFSTIPIHPRDRPSHAMPRIDPASIRFEALPPSEGPRGSSALDGSPDDLDVMAEDQDALIPSVFGPGRTTSRSALPTRAAHTLVPSVFERGRRGRGVHIRVRGGNPAGTSEYPNGIRWVQTIETNAPIRGRGSVYVDFIPPADDGKPFYFTDARANATFSDNPSRHANGARWDATLSLVGVRGRRVTRLDSVRYGFDISAVGTLNLHAPRAVGAGDLVIHSDTLRSGYPSWEFSGGFTVSEVPGRGIGSGTLV